MKNILWLFIFLLPLHAFLITVFKCKYDINVDILRFWKEIILIFLVVFLFFTQYKKSNYSLKKIYHKNTLLGLTTAFIICSAVYIYFPFFELKAASVLWFRYDTFFLIAMIVWLYAWVQWELRYFLKTLFLSTFWILIIFLPWYLFGDISALSSTFGYSPEVSTYTANQCISFAQNVDGQHRFQGTFGGPIRFSVFLTIVWSLFAGWLFSTARFNRKQQYLLLWGFATLILPAIFFSYSKTSMLWALFAIACFTFLSYKYIYERKITRKFYAALAWITLTPLALVALLKWELFLHLWAVINRLDNLSKSLEMFFYNPIGYGLGIAGPASQIGKSIESAGNWQIAAASVLSIHRFLPENWYVQILLEQGIVGFTLFMSLILLIWYRLMNLVKAKKDFLSVGLTTAYFSLCFMALFTHAFEEAATSYILFLFIGIVLAESMHKEQAWKT
jgi:O-antigen ligase